MKRPEGDIETADAVGVMVAVLVVVLVNQTDWLLFGDRQLLQFVLGLALFLVTFLLVRTLVKRRQ